MNKLSDNDLMHRNNPCNTRFAVGILSLMLFLYATSSIAIALPEKASTDKRLKAVIEDSYNPYSFINVNGEPDGFSIDITRAVAKAMSFEVEMQAGRWDLAMKALETGGINLIPIMAYSKARDTLFSFSVPYTIVYDAIFFKKGASGIRSLSDLSGKTVIVTNNDLAHNYLLSSGLSKTLTIVISKTGPDALKQLSIGKADAAIMPKLIGLATIKEMKLSHIDVAPKLIDNYNRTWCFAVKKDDQALLERINQGLAIIKNSGEYNAIAKKWFGPLDSLRYTLKNILKYGGIAALLLLGFLGWNIILKRQVKVKTRYLQIEIANRKQAEEDLRKSDEKQSAMISNISDVIGIIGLDGVMKYKSPNIENWFGWKPQDLVGTDGWLTVHPDDLERIQKEFHTLLEKDKATKTVEYRYKCKDGKYKWIELTATNLAHDPVISGVLLNYHDITERIKMEAELKNSKALLQASIESPEGIVIMAIDKDYQYLCFNSTHSAAMKFAYNKNAEIGMNVLECITSDEDRQKAKANYDCAMAGESHSTIDVFGDVNKSYYESFYNPILNDKKEIIGITAYAIDITKRKQAEEALQISEQKYRSLFNSMLEGFALHEIICDTSGKPIDYRFLDMNPAFEQLTGLKRIDVVGKTVLNIMPNTESSWIEKYGTVALTGERIIFEDYARAFNRHYQVIAFCPKKGQFAVLFTDITIRKKAEEAIVDEKERLSVTLRSIGDGVITTDISGNIVVMNKIAEDLCGWKQTEAQGKPLSSVFTIINQSTRAPHENPVEKVLSTGSIIELANHTLLISRDGTERIIADSGAPIKDKESKTIGVVLVFRDMTEKHKLLDNMQRIDKLDSLGVLAGGIAHDFNNLLGGIFGYIDMARERTTTDKTVSKYLDKALGVFERAKDLTQQLLTFSKGGAPKRKTGLIGKLVKGNAAFVLSGTSVCCDYQIAQDLWLADYDENQIGQVIDNIVLNAQQAMPVGGTIVISVNNISLKDNENLMIKAGNYIKVSITDTGVGIPQELLKRIFDPFFTTKQKGNGLGLATCYSIIQKHDGYIDVESVPGKGSTFHIYLPAAHKGTVQDISSIAAQHKGKDSILVMDDEEFMREIVGDMLTDMGYTLIEAENGEEALQLCTEAKMRGNPISGILFDLTIPGGMGGKETIVKFREQFPEIPVFASSGFSEDPSMARPTEFGFTDSIRKPFKKGELAEMLNKHIKTQK